MPVSTFRAIRNERVRSHLSLALFPFADQFMPVWTELDDGFDYLEVQHPEGQDSILRGLLMRGNAPVEMLVHDEWVPIAVELPSSRPIGRRSDRANGKKGALPPVEDEKQGRRRRRGRGSHAA